MERNEQKLTALQNQMLSLQQRVQQLQNKSPKAHPHQHLHQDLPLCPPVPPPLTPPPPPPLPPIKISRLESMPSLGAMSGSTARVDYMTDEDCSQTKKQRPSVKDLVQRKDRLKVTSIQRSPGGTPLTHWAKGKREESSPEDNAIATVMKKALKAKFKHFRPISPVSPTDGSLNDNDFSL